MVIVQIRQEPAELFKLLKFAGLAGSGGEAKAMIGDGLVRVNGQTETRKRKKLYVGDVINFANQQLLVELEQP